MVFLPFRKLSTRGSLVAVGVCVVLSGVLVKLDQIEKEDPLRFRRPEDVPWRLHEQQRQRQQDQSPSSPPPSSCSSSPASRE